MLIEELYKKYLTQETRVETLTEEPGVISGEFILVEMTSGEETNLIQSAVLRVRCFAESKYKAAELEKRVKEAMIKSVILDDISACRVNTRSSYTDTVAKRYCYQGIYDVTYYE